MVEINVDNFSEVLNDKMDRDMSNTTANVDFVIDSYGPDSSGNWYRIYKSGWVEQGGTTLSNNPDSTITVNLLIPMDNDRYTLLLQRYYTYDGDLGNSTIDRRNSGVNQKTTTSFSCWGNWGNVSYAIWEAKGKGDV